MTIHQEVKLRCEVATRIYEAGLMSPKSYSKNTISESVESANYIVDNAIEKSYEVKK